MAFPLDTSLAGKWTGESTLHLSWLENEADQLQSAPSNLELSVDPSGTFGVIRYEWTYRPVTEMNSAEEMEAGPVLHYGSVLVSGAELDESGSGAVSLGWSDSWHQPSAVMSLIGSGDGVSLSASGTYEVPGYPEWGWTIRIGRDGDVLRFEMDNREPDEEGGWAQDHPAVRAEYRKI